MDAWHEMQLQWFGGDSTDYSGYDGAASSRHYGPVVSSGSDLLVPTSLSGDFAGQLGPCTGGVSGTGNRHAYGDYGFSGNEAGFGSNSYYLYRKQQRRWWSAYILFYEREDFQHSEELTRLMSAFRRIKTHD
ncbi:unnamed protein product, partial [Protopolystoma xenopodis]